MCLAAIAAANGGGLISLSADPRRQTGGETAADLF